MSSERCPVIEKDVPGPGAIFVVFFYFADREPFKRCILWWKRKKESKVLRDRQRSSKEKGEVQKFVHVWVWGSYQTHSLSPCKAAKQQRKNRAAWRIPDLDELLNALTSCSSLMGCSWVSLQVR